MSTLTQLRLDALDPGQWASDASARGAGQLQARRLTTGTIAYYFRYTNPEGKQERIALGSRLSLAQARRKALSLSQRYLDGEKDLKSALLVSPTKARQAPLSSLLRAYVADLKKRERTSTAEVNNAFTRHIQQNWPELWKKPAHLVTTDDLLMVIRHIADQGKLREADKVRSYIRAAYAAAITARQDAVAHPALQAFSITHNPARELTTIRGARKVRERALSLKEVQEYWRILSQRSSIQSLLLQFHLLTGGQRIEQLRRVLFTDIDLEAMTMRIQDPKGRREAARVHLVPLTAGARETLQQISAQLNPKLKKDQLLWSVNGGKSAAWASTAVTELELIIQGMDKRILKSPFTLGDLRRTVETRLAAAGIPQEVRAQLQSHGLSGVQTRHYDRHDYLQEKRAALELWAHLLTNTSQTLKEVTIDP